MRVHPRKTTYTARRIRSPVQRRCASQTTELTCPAYAHNKYTRILYIPITINIAHDEMTFGTGAPRSNFGSNNVAEDGQTEEGNAVSGLRVRSYARARLRLGHRGDVNLPDTLQTHSVV